MHEKILIDFKLTFLSMLLKLYGIIKLTYSFLMIFSWYIPLNNLFTRILPIHFILLFLKFNVYPRIFMLWLWVVKNNIHVYILFRNYTWQQRFYFIFIKCLLMICPVPSINDFYWTFFCQRSYTNIDCDQIFKSKSEMKETLLQLTVPQIKAEMEKILQWLVPIAANTTKYIC